eukprot:TRINITY_DN5767_c0_g1_i1.p1 TRINITY_DN5767_c0_g1~~TRINITY_DN5767_c0_g1_i1.p1  ORF type:complete len:306 (-),score=76.44 TRINITY_DN5767_c0_g1_i1:134-1051(-)
MMDEDETTETSVKLKRSIPLLSEVADEDEEESFPAEDEEEDDAELGRRISSNSSSSTTITTTTTTTTTSSATGTSLQPAASSSTVIKINPLLLNDDSEDELKIFPIDPRKPPPMELASVHKRSGASKKLNPPMAVVNPDGSLAIGSAPTIKDDESESESENEHDEDMSFISFVVLTGSEAPGERVVGKRKKLFSLFVALDLIFVSYYFIHYQRHLEATSVVLLMAFLLSVLVDILGLVGAYLNNLMCLTVYLIAVVFTLFVHVLNLNDTMLFFRFAILSSLFILGSIIRGSTMVDWFPSIRDIHN